jgi:hypothetical protein
MRAFAPWRGATVRTFDVPCSGPQTQDALRQPPPLNDRKRSAALDAEGWTTSVSDLYAMGFDPCERPEHYRDRAALLRFDAQLEQRHASENGGLPKAVTDEVAILDRADLLVSQSQCDGTCRLQC